MNEILVKFIHECWIVRRNCYLDQDFDLDQDILLKDERNINDSKIFKQFLFILKFNKQLLLTILLFLHLLTFYVFYFFLDILIKKIALYIFYYIILILIIIQ